MPSPASYDLFVDNLAGFRRIIRATASGSDSKGDGSRDRPYRTFARAMQDVPLNFDGGRVFVDVTDLGQERIPRGYRFPVIRAGGNFDIDFNPIHRAFPFVMPLNLFAAPRVLETMTNPSVTEDPVTGLKTLIDTSKSWSVDQWKGKFVLGAGLYETAPIASNTATSLELAKGFGSFTSPIHIVELTAEIQNDDPDSYNGALTISGVGSGLAVNGIRLTCANPFAGGMTIYHLPGLIGEMLDLDAGLVLLGRPDQVDISNSRVARNYYLDGFGPNMRRCFFDHVEMNQNAAGSKQCFLHESIFDGCGPVGNGGDTLTDFVFFLSSLLIRNGTSHGIHYKGGRLCRVRQCRVTGCNGSALFAQRPGALDVNRLTGTGNTRYGIELVDGSRAQIRSDVDPAGDLGDLRIGDLAAQSWTSFRSGSPPFKVFDSAGDGSRMVEA